MEVRDDKVQECALKQEGHTENSELTQVDSTNLVNVYIESLSDSQPKLQIGKQTMRECVEVR